MMTRTVKRASSGYTSAAAVIAAPLLAAVALLAAAAPGEAQSLIGDITIQIDGDMSDWTAVLNNEGQYSTDSAVGSDLDDPTIQSTGRDLAKFAFTWDDDYLYFYVERYASSTNANTWLFYLDEDVNGRMSTGEHLFSVDWSGANRSTDAYLCTYIATEPAGDSILGDGHTMPGVGGSDCGKNTGELYKGVTGGATDGISMESRVAWADLGFAGPANVGFHISSSRGYNLPAHVEDNMNGMGGGGDDGGGGGQLFPPDMKLEIASSAPEVGAFEEITLLVTLTNIYFETYTGIQVDVALPSELAYVSHTASGGSYDPAGGAWTIDELGPEEVLELEVVVRGVRLSFAAETTTTGSLGSWTGEDVDDTNNEDDVTVTVLPAPNLEVVKSPSVSEVSPGAPITYTVLVTNTANAEAHDVWVETEIDSDLALQLDTYGDGEHFEFSPGTSGLLMGTPEYSSDDGATWGYVPESGGGGAPAGHDANITRFRIPMTGIMDTEPAWFQVTYVTIVR